jgi:hypothetical protein
VIPAGEATTVTVLVLTHPVERVYKILATPGATPLAKPVVAFIEATAEFELLHVPSGVEQLYVSVSSSQIVEAPLIEEGTGLTVTALVVKQPVGNV